MDQPTATCRIQFPHATELTFWFGSNYMLIMTLNRFILSTQLTHLTINWLNFHLQELVQLLCLTPNVQVLNLCSISVSYSDSLSIQQSESFRLISNQNKIRSLIISRNCFIDCNILH
jgi:hypothetical protein